MSKELKIPIEIEKSHFENLVKEDIQTLKIGHLVFIRKDKVAKLIIDYNEKFSAKMPSPKDIEHVVSMNFIEGDVNGRIAAMRGIDAILKYIFIENKTTTP